MDISGNVEVLLFNADFAGRNIQLPRNNPAFAKCLYRALDAVHIRRWHQSNFKRRVRGEASLFGIFPAKTQQGRRRIPIDVIAYQVNQFAFNEST